MIESQDNELLLKRLVDMLREGKELRYKLYDSNRTISKNDDEVISQQHLDLHSRVHRAIYDVELEIGSFDWMSCSRGDNYVQAENGILIAEGYRFAHHTIDGPNQIKVFYQNEGNGKHVVLVAMSSLGIKNESKDQIFNNILKVYDDYFV